MFRFLLAALPFLVSSLMTDSGGGDADKGDTGDHDSTGDKDDKSRSKIEWTDEQQREIQRIAAKEARKAAEKARQEEKDRIAAEQDQAATEAQRTKDQEAGEFEKVKASIEAERDEATMKLTAATERLTTLETLAQERLDALLAELPKEIAELGPDGETPIEKRLAWAEKAAKAAATREPVFGAVRDPRGTRPAGPEIPSALPKRALFN